MGKKSGHFGDRKGISRRELFKIAGATGAGLAVGGGGVGATLAAKGIVDAGSSPVNASVPFFGRNQAGIATPQQDRLVFAAFDFARGCFRGAGPFARVVRRGGVHERGPAGRRRE